MGQDDLQKAEGCLPIQQWFLTKPLKDKNHFNHSFLIHVNENIDSSQLRVALQKLNDLHETLRAYYPDGKQRFRKESSIARLKELNITGKTEEAIGKELTSWQNSFDVETGYLWQAGIVRGYEDGSERIFLSFHHLVVDAASWPIIREDLKDLYEGKKVDNNGSSYRQWIKAVDEYGKTASADERYFWKTVQEEVEQYQGDWQELAEKDDRELRYIRVEFSPEICTRLLLKNNGNIDDVLLSALSYALYELTLKKKNWITLEKHGRVPVNDRLDVSRTVGWFTTLYPVCLTVGKDIDETVMANREWLSSVPNNGIGYGAIYGYDKMPLILFNYLEKVGGTEESVWQIRMGEASGESMCPDNRYGNMIDINGLQRNGKIGLGVESCLKEKNHTLLCEAFKRNVEAITLHLYP